MAEGFKKIVAAFKKKPKKTQKETLPKKTRPQETPKDEPKETPTQGTETDNTTQLSTAFKEKSKKTRLQYESRKGTETDNTTQLSTAFKEKSNKTRPQYESRKGTETDNTTQLSTAIKEKSKKTRPQYESRKESLIKPGDVPDWQTIYREKTRLRRDEWVKPGDVSDWQTTCPEEHRLRRDSNVSMSSVFEKRMRNTRIALWDESIYDLKVDAVVRSYLDSGAGASMYSYDVHDWTEFQDPWKYIIRVLGPRVQGEEQESALAACYTDCLDEMIKRGCWSLAFSDFNDQTEESLSAAMKATRDWLGKNYQSVEKIIFYTSHSRAVETTMAQLFPVYVDDGICLPVEILRMDSRSIEMYKRALAVGKVSVYNIRVMLVGHSGVGKTTLLNRLLNRPVKIEERESTEGIDVRVCQCKIDPETGQWINSEGESQTSKTHLLASALHFSETSGESNRPLDGSGESDLPVRKTAASHRAVQEVEDHNPIKEYGYDDDPVHVQEVEDHKPIEEYGDANDPVHEAASSLCEYNTGDVEAISDADSATDQTSNLNNSGDHQPASTVIGNEKDGHLKHLKEFVQARTSVSDKQYADVSFWDFAGQSIFYNTHQVFLARRTIYLLVTNIEENIDSAVTDGESVASGNYGKQVKDFIDFWINSIHFFCGEETKKGPPVILVASHADKLDAQHKNTLIASHFESVRDIFGGKVTAKHIMDDLQFAIDNTRPDEKLEALKQAIVDVARVQDYWGEQQPACWISLEQELDKLRQKGMKIIKVKDVEAINGTLPVPLTDAEEIKLFLRFQNNVGNFLFLSEKELEEYVLLDPQWVIDALKCIITAEPFLKNKMAIREHWMELKKTGKLTMDIIDAVWGKPGSPFKSHQDFLLRLMQRLNLIARAKYEEPEQIPEHYFVPCFIIEPPIDLPEHNGPQSSSVLALTVPSGFFPVVIFNKVIASCIKSYTIFKKNKRYCIYNGCAVFEEHGACVFAVFYIDNGIKVWVTSYSQRNCAKSLNTAGHSVLSFLMKSIQDNYHDERQNGVEIYASCPKLPLSSVQRSFKLTSNIQEWQGMEFEERLCSDHDEETHALSKQDILRNWIPCDSTDNDPQSTGEKVTRPRNSSGSAVQQKLGPGPVQQYQMTATDVPERTNCYLVSRLLIEGGKELLIQFLRQSIGSSSLDAFLAAKRNTVNGLRVIHQSQMDILYPPGGGDTDTQKWDITITACILQALITPMAPQQVAAIKDIRELRNRLYGHIAKFEMNENEFQLSWREITQVLHNGANILLNDQGNFNLQSMVDVIQKEKVTNVCALREMFKAWKESDMTTLEAVQELDEKMENRFDEIKDMLDRNSTN